MYISQNPGIRIQHNQKSITICEYVCPRDTRHCCTGAAQSFSLYKLQCLLFAWGLFLCLNRYSALDQMQITSQYLQSNQIAGKHSPWLNLLMSRLPLIRNQLLIQIRTLMFLETQRAYFMGPKHAFLFLCAVILSIYRCLGGGEPKGRERLFLPCAFSATGTQPVAQQYSSLPPSWSRSLPPTTWC